MTHRAAARAAMITQLALLVAACAPMGSSAPGVWRPLFDGSNTNAWRGYKDQTLPAGWRIADGVLTKTGAVGDLISKEQFGNFELALDWKLSPGGNAGVFYRGTEEYDH